MLPHHILMYNMWCAVPRRHDMWGRSTDTLGLVGARTAYPRRHGVWCQPSTSAPCWGRSLGGPWNPCRPSRTPDRNKRAPHGFPSATLPHEPVLVEGSKGSTAAQQHSSTAAQQQPSTRTSVGSWEQEQHSSTAATLPHELVLAERSKDNTERVRTWPETLTVTKTESPPTGVCLYFPPACPHGSITGADPGARHGLKPARRRWKNTKHKRKHTVRGEKQG